MSVDAILGVLSEEHRLIERILNALLTSCDLLGRDRASSEIFQKILNLLDAFVGGAHHLKEEIILFPTLEEHRGSRYRDTVERLHKEHERGRDLLEAITLGFRQYLNGDDYARSMVLNDAKEYARLIRSHIQLEDNAVFPTSLRQLPTIACDRILSGFEASEKQSKISRKECSQLLDGMESVLESGMMGSKNNP